MKREMNISNKIFISVLSLMMGLVVSCGGGSSDQPSSQPVPNAGAVPPPPPPPPGPAPQPAPAPAPAPSVGGFLEDASPGTAVGNDANSWNALNQRFQNNVSFYGNVTVSSVTAVDYNVQNANTSTVTFKRSNQQTLPNSSPTMQIQAQGDSIYLQSPYSGSQVFYFQPQISLYGLVLKSTDVVGLYLSNDGASLLKVQYNVKNPPIQMYRIENYGGWYNSIQIRVTQKLINTNGTYSWR